MKFGQLIEYNMKNIFLKNHSQNKVEKQVPDAFLKKLSVSLDQQSAILCSLFLFLCPSRGLPKYIESKVEVDFLR